MEEVAGDMRGGDREDNEFDTTRERSCGTVAQGGGCNLQFNTPPQRQKLTIWVG